MNTREMNTRVRDTRKSEMNKVADNIESALSKTFADIETKYGYKLKFKGGSFDSEGNLNLRIECLKDGAKSADAQRYDANRILMGLPPLTTVIPYVGKEFVIVGMNTTGSKIKATWKGKTYLLPLEVVKVLWSAQKAV
jgi:hypothetical protein